MKTTFACFSLLFLLILIASGRSKTPVSDTDRLVYSVYSYEDRTTTLYLHDTSSHETTTLLTSDEGLHFVFGSNGKLAFSTGWAWRNNGEIFIMDTTVSDNPVISLSEDIGITGYPLGWSEDGRHLAFASEISDDLGQAIFVWDGTTAIDITPEDIPTKPDTFYVAWSHDGRLAFEVWFAVREPPSEIYIWDGQTTVNLSQNPDAEDREPIWNSRGEIVFGSIGNEHILLLWDGTSYVDGLPDSASFTRVAPELRVVSPFSAWINDDLLAIQAFGPDDSHVQVYTWDGEQTANISLNPDFYNGLPVWNQNGVWASISSEGSSLLNIRNSDNDTLLETRGNYIPAWSSGGSLIFCRRDTLRGWELIRWDQAKLSVLAQGDVINAQWQSGQTTVCSDG